MKRNIGILIFLALLIVIGYLFIQSTKTDVAKEQTSAPQSDLAANCARDIPREKIDDSTLNREAKTVTVYWWDNELQDNVSLILPYEPETDFAGCSESAKQFLWHIRDTIE